MTSATPSVPAGSAHRGTLSKIDRPDGFHTVVSDHSLGENLPQRIGRVLWLPMFTMALMGWAVGVVLAAVEASTARADVDALQTLSHLVPAFMFVGFLGVLSAITFAVARILGAFRRGGGDVQELSGTQVHTLRMPGTARAMLALMAIGMMVLVAGIVTNLVGAAAFGGTAPADVTDSASLAALASGLRRTGVALYLTGIAFGLATIVEVLRFQAIRIREIAAARGHDDRHG